MAIFELQSSRSSFGALSWKAFNESNRLFDVEPLQKLFCQTLHLFDKPTLFGEIKMERDKIIERLSLLLVKSIGGNFALGNDLFPSQVFWWEKYIIDQWLIKPAREARGPEGFARWER